MKRQRVTFMVTVDLDPVPGAFHEVGNAREHIESILKHSIEHYNPSVVFMLPQPNHQ